MRPKTRVKYFPHPNALDQAPSGGSVLTGKVRRICRDGVGAPVPHVRVQFDDEPGPVWVPVAILWPEDSDPTPGQRQAAEDLFYRERISP